MKQVLLALLAVFLFVTPVMAQVGGFSQTGKVTHDLDADGFTMAHPSLPLNTKVQVVNTLTRKEIEVTVIRRIAASGTKIADISPSAWIELGLTSNTEVRIYTNTPAPPAVQPPVTQPPIVPPPVAQPSNVPPAIVQPVEKPVEPTVVQQAPPPPPASDSSETLAQLTARLLDTTETMTQLNARLLEALMERDARERQNAALAARENQETTESLAQLTSRLLDAIMERDAREREEAAHTARENQENTETLAQLTNRLLDALIEREARDIEEARIAREREEALRLAKEREEEARLARERDEAARIARERDEAERIAKEREEAARIAREMANANPPPPPPPTATANQQTSPTQPPAQANPASAANSTPQVQPMDLNIIPRLPDPNNGKVYYLQIGAFSTIESAMDVSQRVINAGFDAFLEFNGFAYRVLVKDIPSSLVYSAAQKLNTIGIREIWLRER